VQSIPTSAKPALAAVPDQDRIAADPRCLTALSKPAIATLLLRVAVVQSALVAALAAGSANGHDGSAAPSADSPLTVEHAAEHATKPAIDIGTVLHHLELRRALNVDARL
jgi:hypothetical protein